MVDLRKALGGLGSRSRGNVSTLLSAPAIAEIEDMLAGGPRVEWSKDFERKCDVASLAVFGITKRDTEPAEPHPDHIPDPNGTRFSFSREALSVYGTTLSRWHDFMACMDDYQREAGRRGLDSYWRARGYEVSSPHGGELRCLPHFHRQLYVAVNGLLPGAKVTLNGSGRRAAQSEDDWGAALEAAAKRFRPTR